MVKVNAVIERVRLLQQFAVGGLLLLATAFFFPALALAQVQPNLENGWKPYGSHDGSNLDTVNHMNGNWMLHVPLFPDIGQRGDHEDPYFLSATAKNWQVSCVPDSSAATGQNCYWIAGGTGVVLDHSNDLRIHRTLNIYNSGNGTTGYEGFGYTVLTADGSSHEMYGLPGTLDANLDATVYESVDTTGYHLVLGGQDSNGVWITVTLFDRQGNQYIGSFPTAYTACSASRPDRNQPPQPGNVAPRIQVCFQKHVWPGLVAKELRGNSCQNPLQCYNPRLYWRFPIGRDPLQAILPLPLPG